MNQNTAQNNAYQLLTITRIREEIPGFKTFYFEDQETENISYHSGQYLTLVKVTTAGEVRRSYSIVSSPANAEPLAIGVKRIANGLFSRFLVDEARPGDQVLTTGAGGLFILPPDLTPYEQLFFLAAGSGITPVFSLLKTVLFLHEKLKAVLIYSNRSPETAIYHQEIQQLANAFPNRLQVEFLYSNAADLNFARLNKDLLKNLVLKHSASSPEKSLAYICGPENYMRMGTYGLHLAGVPLPQIRKEKFTTTKMPVKVQPPDTESHLVTINFRGKKYRFESQFPETILKAARKSGLTLPFSCEAGQCGNCVARCLNGRVWMSHNEVLTNRDLDQGFVLTCVGYPVGGKVELEI